MTEHQQTKLGVQNPHRLPTKVRRLTDEQLEIPTGEEDEHDEESQWESLRETAIKAAEGAKMGAAVRTEDNTILSGSWLSKGSSRDVHALELAVWKGYDESESLVVNVAIATKDSDARPCGRCLQTLLEYSDEGVSIQITDGQNIEEYSLVDLLPR